MSVKVTVTGGKKAKARVRAMRERVNHKEPMWPAVGRAIAREVRKNFNSDGAYFGRPWQPLKPEYRAWKISQGYPRSILVMSGELRDSFTNYPMDITDIQGDSAQFGSSNQKAVWHHYGTHRNGKRVNPPRPILYENPALVEVVTRVMAKYVIDGEVEL